MTINELKGFVSPIKPVQPMTPEKAKINSLKKIKDTAAQNLKAERDRQKLKRAQKTIATVTSTIAK